MDIHIVQIVEVNFFGRKDEVGDFYKLVEKLAKEENIEVYHIKKHSIEARIPKLSIQFIISKNRAGNAPAFEELLRKIIKKQKNPQN